jgi:chromodomain-helicase-DNA-binding protein 4
MSVVQKKLCKSILARSPDLIRSILVKDQTQLRPTERGNLNNILMQLRKVLCHPFLYSAAIEERSASQTVSHRNLIDAASKLQLLEIMLPKLHERGHRVLIFSQFLKQLDIIEDFLEGLGLSFQRLDGNVGSLEKQKRIDAFNAPDSPLFAFLLSTRAGGVGINLASADTVIIMDPDFNPHQDIQALSRAHRIGQKKKVLVFQLMTKDSAEEKIVQIGRKKMALDHALIESMDADDDAGVDLQSILKHGAQALFDDNDQNDIKYDSASVDKLLDRSQVEDTNVGDDKSAESQFSYARIWANDTGTLTDNVDAGSDTSASASTVWDKILKQREADAAREAAAQQKMFGRGKRMRQVSYYCYSLWCSLADESRTWITSPN